MNLIIGRGVSGRSAEKLLLKLGEQVEFWCDGDPEPDFSAVKRVIFSPGVPPSHPLLKRAQKMGLETLQEIELALEHFRGKAVGITGTNGKTTVTELVAHACCFAGLNAAAVGNNGRAMAAWVAEGNAKGIAVCELSSFQLERLSGPLFESGVLLNISEDHLDRYPSMREYLEAKLRLRSCVCAGGKFYAHPSLQEGDSYFNGVDPQNFEEENFLAAFAIAQSLGVSREQFEASLSSFSKPKHRLQFVEKRGGISFYNDSKGTNVDAVLAAVNSFSQKITLIAGGKDKGSDFSPWKDAFQGRVRSVILIGEARQKIADSLGEAIPLFFEESLEGAVNKAQEIASANEVVLLSPGCASFDMFQNFEERGDRYIEIIDSVLK